jgi:hypothetical protein
MDKRRASGRANLVADADGFSVVVSFEKLNYPVRVYYQLEKITPHRLR